MIGLGRAALQMLPSLIGHPDIEVVAVADPRPEAVDDFLALFPGTLGYSTGEALCKTAPVEAVYIATPHATHAPLTVLAAHSGKHVLVEKPMALSIAECEAMIKAAQANGVMLVVGPSHAFDAPVREAARLISSGQWGRPLLFHLFNYTDFLYRPRRVDELQSGPAGGILFNQLPHQVDILRTLHPISIRAVTAVLGGWDPGRPTEGALQALLEFEDGAAASLVYSGYAHFDSDRWSSGVGEDGLVKPGCDWRFIGARSQLAGVAGKEESLLRLDRGFSRANWERELARAAQPHFHPHFGQVLVSCEKGDVLVEPSGVAIYGDASYERVILVPPKVAFDKTGAVEEWYQAVVEGKPPLHDGRWGLETVAICEAVMVAGRNRLRLELSPKAEG